ncbi:SLATT domain-containing protein [Variovorax sp. J22R133]|uniref:SLATT domain-containing protein n=1 Tax=Variovorax brevis TaxID=3053503 RepID=UPI0025777B0A|nr:SLATT domain-containing protein [Variovorax sp. J22R133]MDM0116718.1 SLATT domain-containing protein [Variovorax sp. J22R133]
MDDQEFNGILAPYDKIKSDCADKQFKFYSDKVALKQFYAQWFGAAVLIISLAIPFVTNFGSELVTQRRVDMIVTLMSLLIAAASGLDGLHQWRTTWREYSKGIVQLRTLIGLWDVKVANARQLTNHDQVSKALGEATEELLNKVEQTVSAEMDTFFSARSAIPKIAETRSSEKGA